MEYKNLLFYSEKWYLSFLPLPSTSLPGKERPPALDCPTTSSAEETLQDCCFCHSNSRLGDGRHSGCGHSSNLNCWVTLTQACASLGLDSPYAEWKVGIQGLVALTPSDYSLGHFRDKNRQFQDGCKNNSTWQDNAQNLSPNMKQICCV